MCIHASVFMHVFCNRDREGGEATAGHSFTPSMDASPPHFSGNSWSCHRSDTPPSAYSYLGGSKKRVGEERGRAKLSESNCINVKSICMQKKKHLAPYFPEKQKEHRKFNYKSEENNGDFGANFIKSKRQQWARKI